MMRALACISSVAFLSGAAFSQPAETTLTVASRPAFEAADVHASHVSPSNFNVYMSGPVVHSGQYQIKTATMVDLISAAYGVDQDKVFGGPTWLEMDRYDVIAKLPAGSTPESHKQMLQALLAERFNLVVHKDSKPLPAYVMTAAKHPQLKESDGSSDQPGCRGKPRAQNVEPGTVRQIEVACHNMTMEAFAEQIHMMAGGYLRQPVVDSTGLKGTYDFDIKWTGRNQLAAAGADGISIFDAVDRQLGLKLELSKVPTPVVFVDSVNEKPTDNAPDLAEKLPGTAVPTEFEVASIKPTPPDFQGMNFNILPSGQFNVRGVNLKIILQQAWGNFSDDMIVGAPKWLDQDRFDIVAKVPASAMTGGGPNSPPFDFDEVMVMLKNLMALRFKLVTHMEARPISAYTLVAAKPKLKPADPTGRIKCDEGPGADGKDPRDANPILGRLITCQNMTMARFADMLQSLAPGYIHAPVLDATGLDGAWDFTFSFSTAGQLQGGRGGRDAAPSGAAGGTNAATDPNGALSLLDALPKQLGLKLEMQKRPVQVLVIDHIEQTPTDN
jgi:uncharacterized protein (TIGR03435 family)